MPAIKKEIVKCCYTCDNFSLLHGSCKDKRGKLFLLDPKPEELPCKFWKKGGEKVE